MTTSTSTTSTRPPVAQAVLAGLLAGAVTIGVAELLAALLVRLGSAGKASPVIAVGDAFVDRTPGWLKDFAVSTFGANDKVVLLASIGVVLAVLAVVAGLLARVRLALGLLVVVLLGAVAALAVVTRPGSVPLDVVPTLVGAVAGILVLQALLTVPTQRSGRGWDRRAFLAGAGAAGATAVVTGGLSRVASGSSTDAAASRASVTLPRPVDTVTVPAGVQLPVPGITPFVTPNSDFYRVDTALTVPRLRAEDWKLRIHGMVGQELTLTYDELLALPLVERMTTITCVSNEVGGHLAGNALWLGHPLSELLAKVAPSSDADMVLSTSVDGMTISTPLENLVTGRDALLAVGMNGAPLPVEHGFPVRMVVPGLYGYVSATKWVTDLEVTRFDRDEAYWTPRGYSAKAPIKIASRVDVPAPFAKLPPGRAAVAGVAWAQTRGIAKVQVRVDGGAWQDARLAAVPGRNTWVQWVYEWDATPGNHNLQSRAIDLDGDVQVEERAKIRPNGTTGLETRTVQVA